MGERSVPITLALGCWSATTRRISVSYAPKRMGRCTGMHANVQKALPYHLWAKFLFKSFVSI